MLLISCSVSQARWELLHIYISTICVHHYRGLDFTFVSCRIRLLALFIIYIFFVAHIVIVLIVLPLHE
jgi:hypothetical protein